MVGRGLRLPYGERTGDSDVDAVMLTAHDKFQDILAEAQKGDSIFKAGNVIKAEDLDEPEEITSAQFDVSDNRTLDEVVKWLMEMGYVPSFCTACYREGRTGDRFMTLLKSGQIVNCCHPNALMTLKEYLEDYASEETRKVGDQLIEQEMDVITNPKVKEKVKDYLANIHNGQRDFRF